MKILSLIDPMGYRHFYFLFFSRVHGYDHLTPVWFDGGQNQITGFKGVDYSDYFAYLVEEQKSKGLDRPTLVYIHDGDSVAGRTYDLFVGNDVYSYDASGNLITITRNGRTLASVSYSDSPKYVQFLLADGTARAIRFNKNASTGLVTGVTINSESVATYSYSGSLFIGADTPAGTESYSYTSFQIDPTTSEYLLYRWQNRFGGISTITYTQNDGYPRVSEFNGPSVNALPVRSYSLSNYNDSDGSIQPTLEEIIYSPIITGLNEFSFGSPTTKTSDYDYDNFGGTSREYLQGSSTSSCSSCGSAGTAKAFKWKDRNHPAEVTASGKNGDGTTVSTRREIRYGSANGTLATSEQGDARFGTDGLLLVSDESLYPVEERVYHNNGSSEYLAETVYKTYDANTFGKPDSVVRTQGSASLTTQYEYDSGSGLPTAVDYCGYGDCSGSTDMTYSEQYTYSNGLLTGQVSRNGETSNYLYYDGTSGYLSTITRYPDNSTTLKTFFGGYDVTGHPTVVTDPNGVATNYTYDFLGRVVSQSVPVLGLAYENIYEDASATKSVQAGAVSYATVRNFDADGRVEEETLSDNSVRSYLYDSYGRVMYEAVTPVGSSVPSYYIQNEYDTQGNLTKRILPDFYFDSPSTTEYAYDDFNNLTRITDGNGNTTDIRYDLFGNPVAVKAPDTSSYNIAMSYDMNQMMTGYQVGSVYSLSYSYNGHKQLTGVTSPDFGTLSISYTAPDSTNGLVTSKTWEATGRAETVTTDWAGRTTLQSFGGTSNDSSAVAYDYDASDSTYAAGRLGKVTRTIGATDQEILQYNYDPLGRVLEQRREMNGMTGETVFARSYRADGVLSSETYPTGTQISYDPAADEWGRPSAVTLTKDGYTIDLAYPAFLPGGGPLDTLRFWSQSNEMVETHAHDPAYRTTAVTLYAGSDTIIDRDYSYDPAGNIDAVTDNVDAYFSWAYGYDAANRLAAAVTADPAYASYAYTYDANGLGKRTSTTVNGALQSYVYADALGSGSPLRLRKIYAADDSLLHEYRYDDEGRVIERDGDILTYNQRGLLASYENVSTGAVTQYDYDYLGRRVKKVLSDGTTIYYHYDPEGRLIAETDASGTALKEYVWLDWRPIAMIVPGGHAGDDDDDTVDDDTQTTTTTVPSTSSTTTTTASGDDDDDDCSPGCETLKLTKDLPWGNMKGRAAMDFTVYAIHTDHLGTPIAMTDDSGTVVWTHRFSPFGESLELNEDPDNDGESISLNLRFPGQYYDAESGLHYNWWRYYEPGTGMYMQAEQFRLNSFNLLIKANYNWPICAFAFSNNNPLTFFDFNANFAIVPFIPYVVTAIALFATTKGISMALVAGLSSQACGNCRMDCYDRINRCCNARGRICNNNYPNNPCVITSCTDDDCRNPFPPCEECAEVCASAVEAWVDLYREYKGGYILKQ